MVGKVLSVAPVGYSGLIVEIECDIANGLPSLQIVGLGNKAVSESKDRVRSAIRNSLLNFPKQKITVNMAPAELPKDGSHYDLAIALSILCADSQIRQSELAKSIFIGELALDGAIRPVKGIINMVQTAKSLGYKNIFLPSGNLHQASLIKKVSLYGLDSLKQLYLHLKQELDIHRYIAPKKEAEQTTKYEALLDDIYGQEQAKRALIIAAAGHHNLLLSGPPGAGKTMMAKVLPYLLPQLSLKEKIAVTKLHSLAGIEDSKVVSERPFRAPHHTASQISLIGGGINPKPGEISLAHTGVLFLDEIPEFPRSVLESLRQPLEDRQVQISRSNGHITYPANFMLVATMNPCPCGYLGDPNQECSCSQNQIQIYRKKLSGPLLDRIDMFVNVAKIDTNKLLNNKPLVEKQHNIAVSLISSARKMQLNRYGSSTYYNASLKNRDIKRYISIDESAKNLLESASNRLNLTARSFYKIIKIAQTIADLEGSKSISSQHIGEALQYRKAN